MRSERFVFTALLGLGLLAAGSTASAQAPPGALPGVFGEVLDVRVVNLEVVVTDKRGLPIAGLEPADFRLVVDGEEVAIDYFSEVRGGVAVQESEEPSLPGVPQLAAGTPVGTSYLIFVDDFFSLKTDRNRVLEAVAENVARIGPEDRMAIVAYDGKDLEMLSTWSQSVVELERAFDRARERPAWGLQREAERRQARLDETASIASLVADSLDAQGLRTSVDRINLEPQERFYVQRLSEQLDRSVAAATATLRSFAKPPGRKVLLLLSGGWPYVPAEYLYSQFNRLILDREGLDGDDLYGRLTDTANLLGYTLYPVDVPGLARESAVDVTAFQAPDLQNFSNSSFLREQENHYTLERLAERTGGKAFLNANRMKAFEEVVSDTRSYYWLGFSPERAWDDERHEVKIEMSNPEYQLRSRAGYLDTSRTREVTMAVESTLLFGDEAGSGPLQVELGEPRKAGRKRMDVPITVLVPLSELTFLPMGSGYASSVELRIAVIDEDGDRADIPVLPFVVQSADEAQPQGVGRHQTELRLRRKDHRAVISVYDTSSGRILSSSVDIRQ